MVLYGLFVVVVFVCLCVLHLMCLCVFRLLWLCVLSVDYWLMSYGLLLRCVYVVFVGVVFHVFVCCL